MELSGDRKRRVTPTLDLTPMIDVVLQLLIFFMLSSTFVVQSSIQIEMPQAEGARKLEHKDIEITLTHAESESDGRGRIYLDGVEVASLDELSLLLSQRVADNPEVKVLLLSDTRTQTGRLVEVMGIANSVGISRYGIGATPPENGP